MAEEERKSAAVVQTLAQSLTQGTVLDYKVSATLFSESRAENERHTEIDSQTETDKRTDTEINSQTETDKRTDTKMLRDIEAIGLGFPE